MTVSPFTTPPCPLAVSLPSKIPSQYAWPKEDMRDLTTDKVVIPVVDLKGFLAGDPYLTMETVKVVDIACRKHGFFQIINHGVPMELIAGVHHAAKEFFSLPMNEKQRAQRKIGESWGYSNGYIGRFSSKLPWKETFSFRYTSSPTSPNLVKEYFANAFGQDLLKTGDLCQEYCETMNKLAMNIIELLGLSLGFDRGYLRDFYENNESIMRFNKYPVCQNPEKTLGTGPHTDPTSLTILHQQLIGGLQVFVDEEWQNINPRSDAFVINIGDTLMALTNGHYRSCLHRAVVNPTSSRFTLAYFANPEMEKVVRAPEKLVDEDECPRKYPDFTWSQLLDFTQTKYRADGNTLDVFAKYLSCSYSSPSGGV